MTDTFQVKWTDPGSKDSVDILDTQLFSQEDSGREITHPIREPNGSVFWGKCTIQVRGNVATLTYPEDHRWYVGTARIVFTDNHRKTIKEVLWADEGSDKFENLRPIFQRVEDSEAQDEVARLVELGKIARRPDQALFSAIVRKAYGGKCAVTGCSTPAALEAAHVKVKKGKDLNDLKNGILLRADIHALFDVGLITLTEDGALIQARKELLSDATYQTRTVRKFISPTMAAQVRGISGAIERGFASKIAFTIKSGAPARPDELPRQLFRNAECLNLAVRPEGANYQWRKIPPGELSIDPEADERLGRVTGRAGAS